MIARHFRSMSVTLLLLAAAGAIVATSAWTMEAKTGHGLKLVIVDVQKPSEARDAMHRAFVARLASAATQHVGSPIEIALHPASATEARARLAAGACDAVLVLDEDRPAALRRVDAVTLSGELDSDSGPRPACLIVSQGDAAIRELLTAAFTHMLADHRALKSAATAERDASGVKVAALGL